MPRDHEDPKASDAIRARLIREEALAQAKTRVHEFRSKDWTDDEITQALLGLDKGTVPWRNELLYMLSVSDGAPLAVIYEAIGVTGKQVMALRRKDDEVAAAVRDYMGAYFEDEAMLPHRGIRPQVICAALSNAAHGWNADSLAAMTPEKMQVILRAILDAVRARVTDQGVQRQIGEDIRAALERNQGSQA